MRKESMMKLFKKSAKVLVFIAVVLFLIYWFNFKPYPADHFTVKKMWNQKYSDGYRCS